MLCLLVEGVGVPVIVVVLSIVSEIVSTILIGVVGFGYGCEFFCYMENVNKVRFVLEVYKIVLIVNGAQVNVDELARVECMLGFVNYLFVMI